MDLSKEGIKPLEVRLSALGAIERIVPSRQDRAPTSSAHSLERKTYDRAHASSAHKASVTLAAIASLLRRGTSGVVTSDRAHTSQSSVAHVIKRINMIGSTLKLSINSPFMYFPKTYAWDMLEAPSKA